MNQFQAQSGVASRSWLQRHVPWLGLFALMLSLFRDDTGIAFEPDELNG